MKVKVRPPLWKLRDRVRLMSWLTGGADVAEHGLGELGGSDGERKTDTLATSHVQSARL